MLVFGSNRARGLWRQAWSLPYRLQVFGNGKKSESLTNHNSFESASVTPALSTDIQTSLPQKFDKQKLGNTPNEQPTTQTLKSDQSQNQSNNQNQNQLQNQAYSSLSLPVSESTGISVLTNDNDKNKGVSEARDVTTGASQPIDNQINKTGGVYFSNINEKENEGLNTVLGTTPTGIAKSTPTVEPLPLYALKYVAQNEQKMAQILRGGNTDCPTFGRRGLAKTLYLDFMARQK
ncbi:MAG: hypothetical protein HC817_10300 [Saprospiraceae bacterium]|nr:hypothetical protein [Saprospiraceae bacterium]